MSMIFVDEDQEKLKTIRMETNNYEPVTILNMTKIGGSFALDNAYDNAMQLEYCYFIIQPHQLKKKQPGM